VEGWWKGCNATEGEEIEMEVVVVEGKGKVESGERNKLFTLT
jgi:hypothetical protein